MVSLDTKDETKTMIHQKAVVVGAGINGLLLAKELFDRGWSVTVCDQGSIPNPNSASHGKHRLLHPWSHPSGNVALDAGEALVRWKTILSEIKLNGFYDAGVVVVNKTKADSEHSVSLDKNSVELSDGKAIELMPQLKGGNFHNITFYPGYGCLLADQILKRLVSFLADKGVHFRPDFKVEKVDPQLPSVTDSRGDVICGDKIFVAAGTGTTALTEQVNIGCGGQAMRCFVLYLGGGTETLTRLGSPCWASLIVDDDLWGMPPVQGISAKLGCGDLTHQCQTDEQLINPTEVIEDIVKRYRDNYPLFFSGRETFRLDFNHWTKFETRERIHVVDNAIFTAACSGVGFKLAPVVAKEICDQTTKL